MFFHRGGINISRHSTFMITESGRDRLQEATGDMQSQVLLALESGGSQNIDEISNRTGIPRGKVERIIPSLVQSGRVQISSANRMDI